LARFAAYCCSRRLEPKDVCDNVMSAFEAHLDQRHLGKDPAKICKVMAQTWNGIIKRYNLALPSLTPPAEPAIPLPPPDKLP
jgi:hypothetical protein